MKKALLLAAWLALSGLNSSAQTSQKLEDVRKHIYGAIEDSISKKEIGEIIDRLDSLNIKEDNTKEGGSLFWDSGYDMVTFDGKRHNHNNKIRWSQWEEDNVWFDEKSNDSITYKQNWDDIIIHFEKRGRYKLTVVLGTDGKVNFTVINTALGGNGYKKIDNQPMPEELQRKFYNDMIKLFNSVR